MAKHASGSSGAGSCALRGRCQHAAEAAITGLPLATFAAVPELHGPDELPPRRESPRVFATGWAARLDTPPPRVPRAS